MESDSSDSIVVIPKKREKYFCWIPDNKYAGPDLISNLPDFVIGHILSYLPIKTAVRTSILSTRWKKLWTFVSEVEIEDRDPCSRKRRNKTRFQNFLYRILSNLNASSIQSFSITLSELYLPRHIDMWISQILSLRVKELYIVSKRNIYLPFLSLTESPFLEVLVLDMCDGDIDLPTSVSFPSITVLKFSGITFTGDSSSGLQNLTLNFPALRKYETVNCNWVNFKGVTLEVPLLEVLVTKNTLLSVPEAPHTVVKYCAPSLRGFSYVDNKPDTILLDIDLSSTCIATASILTYIGNHSMEQTAFLSCRLLKQISNNVECLKFRKSEILALLHVDLPAFGMLTRLKLGKVTGESLLKLLRKTPFLKILNIKELLQFDEVLANLDDVPSCFISNLEVVNFGRLNGDNHELSLIKYVMENSQVLERVVFLTCWNLRRRRSKFIRVREKILSFKRSDKFEFIEFSSYFE